MSFRQANMRSSGAIKGNAGTMLIHQLCHEQ